MRNNYILCKKSWKIRQLYCWVTLIPETQSGIDTKQNTKLGAILEVVIQ